MACNWTRAISPKGEARNARLGLVLARSPCVATQTAARALEVFPPVSAKLLMSMVAARSTVGAGFNGELGLAKELRLGLARSAVMKKSDNCCI